ncbi:MAG: phage tail sheath C-terminal domain-containing protein [Spirulina sp.]
MTEMIIPGTYIAVRSEGLISAGRVATGIVGVVGTAASGPIGQPITLAGFAQARELFGLPDAFENPADGMYPLTLVRSLEQIYGNGASTVVAVRVAGASQSKATYGVQNNSGDIVATLEALTPGTRGNDIQVVIVVAEDPCRITGEVHNSDFDQLGYGGVVPSPENQLRVYRGVTKRSQLLDIVYKAVVQDEDLVATADGRFFVTSTPVESVASVNQVVVRGSDGTVVRTYGDGAILYGAGNQPGRDEIRINTVTGEVTFEASQVPVEGQAVVTTYAVGHKAPLPGQVLVTTWNGELDYATGEAPNLTDGDILTASYLIDPASCVQLTLTHDATSEVYITPDGEHLTRSVNATSRLVRAVTTTHSNDQPRSAITAFFGTGSNVRGSNGAEASRTEYAAGLESLANQLINIVVLAGQDAQGMGSVLLGHLKATEQTDVERIGVIGAPGTKVEDFLGHRMADGRVIVVGPGIQNPDGSVLPPAYTAAAVAGLIASLSVQTSLTNKPLNVPGLAVNANRGQQIQLIKRNVLMVVPKLGYRVLKGITTDGEGNPFSAIPTRRIVDYAKYGVRSAANPYIGRLNNARVRGALKATLDAFLTRMVEDEALTGYALEVTATRAQEIAGEVNVTMTLQPTFSIDFIRVTMNLK